jgi:acetate kinase
VLDGRSVATTMGFSPLEGVPMATRSGSIDPAAVLYLVRTGRLTVAEVERALEQESGLLGLSGISARVEELERSTEPSAALALDVFVYQVAVAVCSLVVPLGGLDAVVFTGGVGERSARVRAGVCERLGFLGVAVDDALNASVDADADVGLGPVSVRVVHAREDVVAAREARRLLDR